MEHIGKSIATAMTSANFALVGIGPDGSCPYFVIYREDVPSLAAAVKRLGDESSFVLEETLWSIPERQRERALQFWRGLRAIEGDPTLKTHYIEQKGLLLDSWASTLHNALNVMAYYNTGVLIALGSEHSEGIRTIDRIYREASAKRN